MIDYNSIQEKLGFTDTDKANWLEINGKYYDNPEQGWVDKLMMHAYPQRSASVYVMPAYQSPVTGKWIDTPGQRREDMKRNNYRPWEGMEAERKVADERVKREAKESDKALDNAVVSAYQALGSEKQAALESSL